ncbi:MAG: hypothetical protein KA715_13855 [Xanthomonadaceae bacterium]|nr:hypothetical protein [Xanthomonadaceae bacterium]
MSTRFKILLCLFGLVIGCASDKPLLEQDSPRGPGALTRVITDLRLMGNQDKQTVEYRISEFLRQTSILAAGESIDVIVGTTKEDEALGKIKEQFQNEESFFYKEFGLSAPSRDHVIQKIDQELAVLKTSRGVASKSLPPMRESRRPIGGQAMFY